MEKNLLDLTLKELLIMFWNSEGIAKNCPTFEDFILSIMFKNQEETNKLYNDHMKSKP
jgi:hypothetical protein